MNDERIYELGKTIYEMVHKGIDVKVRKGKANVWKKDDDGSIFKVEVDNCIIIKNDD